MKLNQIEEWGLMPSRTALRLLGWRWNSWVCGNAMWEKRGVLAALSAHVESDSKRWLHLSMSASDRVPSYSELQNGWRAFLNNRHAYQCFVPTDEHVNIHPNCLHLWAPLDHRPLPDFRHEGGI